MKLLQGCFEVKFKAALFLKLDNMHINIEKRFSTGLVRMRCGRQILEKGYAAKNEK